jgi:poly-gamma-glutamate synthesis protein (capsule biosynthesis protein)
MLGRGVATALRRSTAGIIAPEVVAVAREADLVVLNLECAISDRGERWPDPRKPFFFRAPPAATAVLRELGVGCVTLANNHALDYGRVALLDTFEHLDGAGIPWVGAGADEERARRPAVLESGGMRVAVVGVTDHPVDFAAGPGRPGVAYADLSREPVPAWLVRTVEACRADADIVLVSLHWGPNMASEPVPHVRAAARRLLEAGATLVAGHSAHVFHGVADRVLFDLGDFVDDYAVDPVLRNDMGLLWLVTVGPGGPTRIEAVPLRLEYCHTRCADRREAEWIAARLGELCRPFGTAVEALDDRLLITPGG